MKSISSKTSIIAVIVLLIVTIYYLKNTNTTENSDLRSNRVLIYHYVIGNDDSYSYQSDQFIISDPTNIEGETLMLLFEEFLPKLKSEYLGISIEGGVATVMFKGGASKYISEATPGVSSKYTNSINKTLLQFNSIKKVQYSIDGKVITDWDA